MKVRELMERLSKYDGDLPIEAYNGYEDICFRGDFSVSKNMMRSAESGAVYEIVTIGLGSSEATNTDDLLETEA